MKTTLLALALGTALVTGAQAADVYQRGSTKDGPDRDNISSGPGVSVNWTGLYVGGQGGYGNANHNLEISDEGYEGDPIAVFLDGINSHGFFGGGRIGFDIQRGPLLFGVWGQYDFTNAETVVGATGSPDVAIIEEGDSYGGGVRAGMLFGSERRALLYVLGGYGQQEMSYNFGEDTKADVDFSGFIAGAGAEFAVTPNVFVGLEYQHFFGGKEDVFREEFGEGKLTDDLDSDRVMATLKIKLNTGSSIPGLSD